MKFVRLAAVILLGFAAIAGIGACTMFHNLPTLQSQLVTQCSIVNGDLAVIAASPLLSADQQKFVNEKVLPANKAFCTAVANANVSPADAKTLHDQLLPAVITIVQGLPTLPDQTAILLGLNTFGPLVQQIVDQIVDQIITATAASAPVAASTPLSAVPIQ